MAYTQHPAVNAGDYWTAANQNSYVKDNFDYIASNGTIRLDTSNYHQLSSLDWDNADVTPNISVISGIFSGVVSQPCLNYGQNEAMGWIINLPQTAKKLNTIKLYCATTSSTSPGNIDFHFYMKQFNSNNAQTYQCSTVSNGSANVVYEHELDISEYGFGYATTDSLFAIVLYRSNTTDDVYGAQDVYVYGINLIYSFTT